MVLEQDVHAIVTTVLRNKYKSVCVCVCVCVCVFGTGEEEKEVNRDRGGTCQRHRASGQQTHTQALCMALTDHDAPSLVVYFWE